MLIQGIPACPGIVSGKIFVLSAPEITVNQRPIDPSQVDSEIQSFHRGRELAKAQLENIRNITAKNIGEEEAAIFEGHLEILLDEEVENEIVSLIRESLASADFAAQQVAETYISTFEAMEDEYMKARAADMKDIFRRLVANILNTPLPSLAEIDEPVIVAATDLTPSDTAQMDRTKVLGFITAEGGPTSHVAIMSRTLVIPAIVGARELMKHIKDGMKIILDAQDGAAIISPTPDETKIYESRAKQFASEQEMLKGLKNLAAITKDGYAMELCANVGTDIDALPAIEQGAEGVGLYRTEFLYMDRSNWPTEEEQAIAYSNVVRAFNGKLVVIRTLDIGGDKSLSYFKFPHEENPFLGWRALRVCLDRPEIFKTQLRAILRASALGPVGIMYPMVIAVDEVKRANQLLEECKAELRAEKVPFDEKIQQGIMIETPAAAMLAGELARIVDFFSYGTNDLIQYTLAVDRGNPHITKLYENYHPSVLRLMAKATEDAIANNSWVGVCGEMGGDPIATLFFLGIGVKELSMSAINIPKVKQIVRSTTKAHAIDVAKTVLSMSSSQEIQEYLKKEVDKILV
ncbi:MAG: phosphoenolpyruvate--protein phosphotransferase [Brevinema sp.]